MQDAIDQLPPELKETFTKVLKDHKRVVMENGLLREQLRLMRIDKYGPRSEKLSDDQLDLLDGELSVTAAEVEQEAQRAEEEQPKPNGNRKKKHPGRAEFPPHLERRVTTIPCSPEECVCPHCQEEKAVIGHERTEELGVIPAYYYVKVTLRAKRACHEHPEGGVVCAPCLPWILPKSKLSDEMIVDVLIRKYGRSALQNRRAGSGNRRQRRSATGLASRQQSRSGPTARRAHYGHPHPSRRVAGQSTGQGLQIRDGTMETAATVPRSWPRGDRQ